MDKLALTLVNGSLGRRANDQVMWDVMCMCVGVLVCLLYVFERPGLIDYCAQKKKSDRSLKMDDLAYICSHI